MMPLGGEAFIFERVICINSARHTIISEIAVLGALRAAKGTTSSVDLRTNPSLGDWLHVDSLTTVSRDISASFELIGANIREKMNVAHNFIMSCAYVN